MSKYINVLFSIICFVIVTSILGQPFAKHEIDADLSSAGCLTIANFDSDDKKDIIVSGESGLKWYKNLWTRNIKEEDLALKKHSPIFIEHMIDKDAPCFKYVRVADINGSEKLDILGIPLLGCESDIVCYVDPFWKNDAINVDRPTAFDVKDFNNDGLLDIVATSWANCKLSLYLAGFIKSDEIAAKKPTKSKVWNEHIIDANLLGAGDVKISDIDDDGDFDIVVTSNTRARNDEEIGETADQKGQIFWYENDNLKWEKNVITNDFAGIEMVEIADIDNDNDADIVATGYDANRIAIFYNFDSASFWKSNEIKTDFATLKIKLADIDGDTYTDIVTSGPEVVMYKNSNGNWTKFVIDNDLNGASGLGICDFDGDGDGDIVATGSEDNADVIYENIKLNKADIQSVPFKISQNYPNPFNPLTIINYELPITTYVDLSVYNMVGQKVAALVSKKQAAGNYSIEWNASGFSSGVYFYRFQVGKHMDIKKMVLMK